MSNYYYVQGLLHSGVLTYITLLLSFRGSDILGFLHSGILMFRSSNAFSGVLTSRGCNIQVFLGSEVVMSKGSSIEEFLCPDTLTSRGSYIQRF